MDNLNVCERESWERTDSEEDSSDESDDKLCKEADSERLSDIDDREVGSYLNDEKEKDYKKIIWDLMNQKYLQEQEAKKDAATSNVTNSRKELKHKKATGAKKTQSTAKLAHPSSPKKRTSSRINYNALSEIIDDHLPPDKPKKKARYSESDNNIGEVSIGTQVNDATNETEDEENDLEDDANYSHYNNNQEEEFEYYDDEDDFF